MSAEETLTPSSEDRSSQLGRSAGTMPAEASRRLPRWWTESGRRQRPGVSVGVGTSGVRQCACDMAARRYHGDPDDALHLAM